MQEYLEIGQIVNTHGIRGYVKVVVFADDIKAFENIKNVYIVYKKELIKCEIQDIKYLKNVVSMKLDFLKDINEAEKYKGCYLKVKRSDMKALQKNTFYITDLIECEVYGEDNKKIGILSDIFSTGSNDVFVIKTDEGNQVLLPAVSKVIKNINIEERKVIVDISQGVKN